MDKFQCFVNAFFELLKYENTVKNELTVFFLISSIFIAVGILKIIINNKLYKRQKKQGIFLIIWSILSIPFLPIDIIFVKNYSILINSKIYAQLIAMVYLPYFLISLAITIIIRLFVMANKYDGHLFKIGDLIILGSSLFILAEFIILDPDGFTGAYEDISMIILLAFVTYIGRFALILYPDTKLLDDEKRAKQDYKWHIMKVKYPRIKDLIECKSKLETIKSKKRLSIRSKKIYKKVNELLLDKQIIEHDKKLTHAEMLREKYSNDWDAEGLYSIIDLFKELGEEDIICSIKSEIKKIRKSEEIARMCRHNSYDYTNYSSYSSNSTTVYQEEIDAQEEQKRNDDFLDDLGSMMAADYGSDWSSGM